MFIALDAMSGDFGIEVTVPAAARALQQHADLQLILVGQLQELEQALIAHKLNQHPRLQLQAASEIVGMDEEPAKSLRGKKDSSMRVALNLVREGKAQACVSAGNTGALMATARFVLKTLPGVDRPAIVSQMPSRDGHTHMLDLGANAECTPEQLYQFAVMGTVLARAVSGLKAPRVGLLNIGSEDIKGTQSIKQAAELLIQSDLNYIGYVEGTDIFLGDVDVVVCDGFSGNVALKSAEGVSRLIAHYFRQEYDRNIMSRIAALLSFSVLRRLKKQFDPGRHNGASLLGLNGIVIKSHGNADAKSLAHAIDIAVIECQKQIIDSVGREVADHLLAEATP